MNEIIIERLARRLLKCSFDGELFDSALSFRLHLCNDHRTQISRPHRVACQADTQNTERPKQLYCCPHCDFVVPEPSYQNPHSGIGNHIQAKHPNPNQFEPTKVSFTVSTDEELIDGYMEQQGSIERRACARDNCTTICADDDSIALHWVEEHCETATVEEIRQALEADSEKFRILLAEIFRELEEEEARYVEFSVMCSSSRNRLKTRAIRGVQLHIITGCPGTVATFRRGESDGVWFWAA
jgi:hypothetical protein